MRPWRSACSLRSGGSRLLFAAVVLLFGGNERHQAQEQDKKVDTGIEVVGRSAKEPPLLRWFVVDAKTKKSVSIVDDRWGFTPVPPGDYELRVQKYEIAVPYGTVKVIKDKVTTVEVKAGVELVGQTENEEPLYRWSVVDPKTKKPVTYVDTRWGFTPVPPGDYELLVKKYEVDVPYGKVQVSKDKATRVEVKSGVEVFGRSDKEPPLYRWSVVDPKTKKQVTHVDDRWGFTPVPPGDYELWVKKYEVNIRYAKVQVSKDKATRVEIKSGVELLGRSDKEPPLFRWWVIDPKTKESVTHVDNRWGFTPVLPGDYMLKVQPEDAEPFTWAKIAVADGKTTTVKMNSGIELSPLKANDKPPEKWFVYDPATKNRQALTQVQNRWGVALVPPGEYAISDRLPLFPLIRVKVPEGEVAKVRMPELTERLATVTGAGRKTEKQRDPAGFKKLEEEIERAIRRGAAWLKTQGHITYVPQNLRDDDATIGILALLHAGEFERDPALRERCLDYLLRRRLNTAHGTYATALTTMALADLDPHAHPGRMLECAQWLVENQGWDKERKVWGYGDAVPGIGEEKKAGPSPLREGEGLTVVRRGLIKEFQRKEYWDNSCSQFGVLGLHSAAYAGIKVPRKSWELIEQHFREDQNADGGWGYQLRSSSYGSMTCAGLASLVLARHHLGQKTPDLAVVKGLEWLATTFTVDENPMTHGHHYYYLYGPERAGVLAGTEFLGDHEWYPEGARYLLAKQNADGSWRSKIGDDSYLDTCYAILFLRRATLPPVPPKPGFIRVTYDPPVLPPNLTPAVDLTLDCSGSMKDKIKDETKMTIARRVIDKLMGEMPDYFHVGLRVFGHQGFWDWRKRGQAPDNHPGWNVDTEVLIPIGALGENNRRAQMKKWINYLEPAGATPLVYALLQARNDFATAWKGPKMVVLVSDGLDTCGGKMEDIAKAYKGSGIDVVIHVVGFGVTEKEHKQLEALAKMGRGNYYRVADATQLAEALRNAMSSLHFVVHNEHHSMVAQAVINGPGVQLKPGNYLVSISGLRDAPVPVRLENGQKLQLVLDKTGKLTVPPGANGQAPPNADPASALKPAATSLSRRHRTNLGNR